MYVNNIIFDSNINSYECFNSIPVGGLMNIIIPGPPVARERMRHGCTRQRKPYLYDLQKQEMIDITEVISRQFSQALESKNNQIALKASEIASAESFSVSLVFIFTIPRSCSLGARNAILWGMTPYNQKPDNDNLEKTYLDCATRAGIWQDDAQVACLNSKKIYGESARTEMSIVANRKFLDRNVYMKALCVFSPNEMCQLLTDAKALSSLTVDFFTDSTFYSKTNDYQSAALIAFANKYADKLMKVKRIAAKATDDEMGVA